MKKPEGFEDSLSEYKPLLYDGWCGEPVSWGFEIIKHLGDEQFGKLRAHGEVKYLSPGTLNGSWGLIVKTLTRKEAAKKYGKMKEEEFGPRGGWKTVTFGEKKFCSKYLSPE